MKNLKSKGIDRNAYIEPERTNIAADPVVQYMSAEALEKTIKKTRKSMETAASKLDFIEAARFRDELAELENLLRKKAKDN